MAENALEIQVRDATGKGVARKLRAAGRIPGICYGKGETAIPIDVDPVELRRLLEGGDAGMNTLIHLKGDASVAGKMVLVRELQRDPVRGGYLHADFYAIDAEQRVEVSVPIHIEGKPPGVEQGGILDHSLREMDLVCLPLSIPTELIADVSALDLGDSLHVRDIPLPDGVELKSDPDLSVVSVVAPKAEEEEAPAEEGEELEAGAEGEEAAAEGEEAKKDAPAEAASGEKSGD